MTAFFSHWPLDNFSSFNALKSLEERPSWSSSGRRGQKRFRAEKSKSTEEDIDTTLVDAWKKAVSDLTTVRRAAAPLREVENVEIERLKAAELTYHRAVMSPGPDTPGLTAKRITAASRATSARLKRAQEGSHVPDDQLESAHLVALRHELNARNSKGAKIRRPSTQIAQSNTPPGSPRGVPIAALFDVPEAPTLLCSLKPPTSPNY